MKQSGIYALWYEEQDLIYIGQSVELPVRKATHYHNLKSNKHSNYKLQNAYNKYGEPEFVVLEYAEAKDLDKLELDWQNEFDSLSSLDIVQAGESRQGLFNGNSKHTKVQLLCTLRLCIKPELTSKNISNITGVGLSIVDDIRSLRAHKWLLDKYPWHCSQIEKTRQLRIANGYKLSANSTLASKRLIVLISPSKEEFVLNSSLKEFAKEHKLDSSDLSRVISGKYRHTKGWTIKQ